jgi:hypothetical protein
LRLLRIASNNLIMIIGPEIIKYLKGESFENSLRINIDRKKYEIVSREAVITEIIRNKNVVHIGCSDHIQIINSKLRTNTWLHKLITDNSNSCIGIDINKESIDFVKNELGYQNVIHGNILTDDFEGLRNKDWDYAVFGEIIEHLDDPGIFLRTFREKYGENVKKFIVTVPSIYNIHQFSNMMNYTEIINSDHRFWFTPYTIAKLLVSAGYNPEKITYSNLQSLNFRQLLIRKIKRMAGFKVKYPFYYFNTLVISGNIKS